MIVAEELIKELRPQIEESYKKLDCSYSISLQEWSAALLRGMQKFVTAEMDLEQMKASMLSHLQQLNLPDLVLAVACAKGDSRAWEDFVRQHQAFLLSIARSLCSNDAEAHDLAASAIADLYGLREGQQGRISKMSFYSGRGSLRGWLRAVIYQLHIDRRRQDSHFVQPEEDCDLDLAASYQAQTRNCGNEETALVEQRYRAAVAQSLERALKELDTRDRLLLNYYYYDDLRLRQIAVLLGVHEATISRWLSKVQKRIRKSVEKTLRRDFKFNRTEIRESLSLAAESLDVNIREWLGESAKQWESETSPKRSTFDVQRSTFDI